jgi:hypothetical protein
MAGVESIHAFEGNPKRSRPLIVGSELTGTGAFS